MKSVSITICKESDSHRQAVLWGRRLLLGTTGGILIFAPLAYGGVHTWAYFTIGLVAAILSLTLLTGGLIKIWAKTPEKLLLFPYPPLWWLALGIGLIPLIQIMPWPQALLRWISPTAWQIRALGNGFALADYLPLSLNPYATLLEFLKLWPAVILFFILIYTINSRQKIKGLTWLILVVASFEVIYGFFHFRSHLIWGWPNPYTGMRLCGTFINSNHLALFLAMAILLGYGLFLAYREAQPRLSVKGYGWSRVRRWSSTEHIEPQFRRLLLLFFLVFLAVGLIFTGSRGGMVSLLAGFALMALLSWGQRWRKGHIFIMIIFLAAAVLYSLILGSGQVVLTRYQNLTDQGRYYAFHGALALFREFPWLGSGVATFGDVFYRYEPSELNGVYFIYAHSDWLQLLAETGILGFLLVVSAWWVFFSRLVKQWRQRHDVFARGVGLGGLAALGAGVFNGLGEFSFHIPAIQLLFTSIAALTYLTVYNHHRHLEYFSYLVIDFTTRRRASTFLLLALIGVQLVFVFQIFFFWKAEQAAPTEINSTRPVSKLEAKDYQTALSFNTKNSRYYAGLAETLLKAGEGNEVVISEIEKSLRTAIFQSPSDWRYRLSLAEFYLHQQRHAPAHYIPLALRELAAAVTVFPGSLSLTSRLVSVLIWAEIYYPGLIPSQLFQSSAISFSASQ